jgi:hypothetical protein
MAVSTLQVKNDMSNLAYDLKEPYRFGHNVSNQELARRWGIFNQLNSALNDSLSNHILQGLAHTSTSDFRRYTNLLSQSMAQVVRYPIQQLSANFRRSLRQRLQDMSDFALQRQRAELFLTLLNTT